jgi:SAM-dependent methyltransferase
MRDPQPAVDLYERALAGEVVYVRHENGSFSELPVRQWIDDLKDADTAALSRVSAPVLDVGCGPGRHLLALAFRGIDAMGVDISAAAVERVTSRGGAALVCDVFDTVPRTGQWASALLLDGNIGIGGQPESLLRRLRVLLCAAGEVICEFDPPGARSGRELVRLETAHGIASRWFPWARISIDDAAALALSTGFDYAEEWELADRWFARLRRSGAETASVDVVADIERRVA